MAVAIVLAGGKGSRMNSEIAKQYMLLDGKELICYSLQCFNESEFISDIILVTGACDIQFCKEEIVSKYGYDKVRTIVSGGEERYDSVYQGLLAAQELCCNDDIVMIHDGARPFVTEAMIADSVKAVATSGSCTVAVAAKDTIKIVDSDMMGIDTPDRKTLYQIQTPQTFSYKLLRQAYEKLYEDTSVNVTDDTMVMEKYMGVRTKIIEGSYANIKITTPEDLDIAGILKNLKKNLKNS